MKLAIIGSRSFDDYDLLSRMVSANYPQVTMIISGGARGADELARQFAFERGIEIREYLPEWKRHGRAAGQIRNRLIIDDADAVLAFWDGSSKGTRGGLEYARKQGKEIVILHAMLASDRSTVPL
jgi:predicted Rossmann fold nucleotide-binding protein DprA/Smf involved in DNA uptake